MKGGDNWISEVYNRDATGRSGFLMFSIGKKKRRSSQFAITAHMKLVMRTLSQFRFQKKIWN